MRNLYHKTTLDNGLRIISRSMPDRQSVALGIWIRSGGRYESKTNKGISHYLEHLLFKGSKKYSCRRIKESIEGVGGSLNGFTSEELTCYLVKMPENYLDLGLDVLSDMVKNPLLLQQDIDKERNVILEEIKMYKDLPQSYVHELLDELLWPGQPLGMSIAGSRESVMGINRQELVSFSSKYYTPANIVVSAAGLLKHDKIVSKVKGVFERPEEVGKNIFIAAQQNQSKPQLKLFQKDTEQTHLAMGFHSFQREHKLKHAQTILHIILGANMSSRLFEEIREKRGLAYEIGTQLRRFEDTGAFVVHAGIDNNKVVDAISLILIELVKVKDKLVSVDEFGRAREFYLGQLKLAFEETMDHMLWMGESCAASDKVYFLSDVISEVGKLRRQDIQEAAKAIFKEGKLNLALIGPSKYSQELIYKQLRLGS